MGPISQILIYPIKSLDGVEVAEIATLASGALAGDRRLALVDANGRLLNGKRTPRVQAIRAVFDGVTVSGEWSGVTLSIADLGVERFGWLEWDRLAAWLSPWLGESIRVVENMEVGFPDDLESPGPTLVSTASLGSVGSWFGLSAEETRRRFRANIEIAAEDAFDEDRLFGEAGETRPVAIGRAVYRAVNPCQRCVVPTRDSLTGESVAGFQKEFARRREASLPAGVVRSRFNHFYRLAVNTRPGDGFRPEAIRVGDVVGVGGVET
jgi:uncharacterized protein